QPQLLIEMHRANGLADRLRELSDPHQLGIFFGHAVEPNAYVRFSATDQTMLACADPVKARPSPLRGSRAIRFRGYGPIGPISDSRTPAKAPAQTMWRWRSRSWSLRISHG